MDDKTASVAIDFSKDPKNTSLYFDSLLPYGTDFDVDDEQYLIVLNNLLPKSIPLVKVKDDEVCMLLRVSNGDQNVHNLLVNVNIIKNYTFSSFNEIRPTVSFFRECPIVYPSGIDPFLNQEYEATALKLLNLSLIDTTNAEWGHIIQLRKDKNSINKLQRLKLFFHEKYEGKDKLYIQDDLQQRVYEYQNVAKDWGFETITSSIEMLLTSPLTLASVGTSLAIALFGEPLSAIATAGTGVSLEIGKMSLHIAKAKRKFATIHRDHPLAFIIDAKKKLSNSGKRENMNDN